MGVQGLWKIVGPVARPITLESLEDKRLAIDASIWLYQFQMAMRDRKTGDTLHGAHISASRPLSELLEADGTECGGGLPEADERVCRGES